MRLPEDANELKNTDVEEILGPLVTIRRRVFDSDSGEHFEYDEVFQLEAALEAIQNYYGDNGSRVKGILIDFHGNRDLFGSSI